MIGCKDTDCIINLINMVLEKYGIKSLVNQINLKVIDGLSKYEDGNVTINILKYDEIYHDASGESELISSFILLASLYSIVGIKKSEEIILNEFGTNSLIYKLHNILLA